MALARRVAAALFVAAIVTTGVGCTMFETMMHELQPHRLRRLNSGPGMSSDAYYSVPDMVPTVDESFPPIADRSQSSVPPQNRSVVD